MECTGAKQRRNGHANRHRTQLTMGANRAARNGRTELNATVAKARGHCAQVNKIAAGEDGEQMGPHEAAGPCFITLGCTGKRLKTGRCSKD